MSDFESSEEIELPELTQGVLDDVTLVAYFSDLATHAEVFDVTAKGAPEAYAEQQSMELALARNLLETRLVRGIQIRYRFEGAEWWDTLIRLDEGVRLVRIEHDFSDL